MSDEMREYPRGGVANGRVENETEKHLMVPLLIDTSGSLHGYEKDLEEGIRFVYESLDANARGKVELMIISFDDKARILQPFAPAYEFEVPKLDCDGMTSMHQAVKLVLDEIEARKKQFKEEDTPYFRPLIYCMTDGKPNDNDNGEFELLKQAQRDKKCLFIPVAIGNQCDTDLLKSLDVINNKVIKVSKDNIKAAMVFLSNSISLITNSKTDTVQLEGGYQIEVE